MTPLNRAARAATLLALLATTAACARLPAHLGVRPDEPVVLGTSLVQVKGADGRLETVSSFCAEYLDYATYVQKLQEAYHSRSTQNRWWIYVAGITGIGVAAASGGLAVAAAASATTLALLAISGGATAAAFATLNNEALAQNYTTAANQLDKVLADAEKLRLGTGEVTIGSIRLGDVKVGDVKVGDLVVDGKKVGDVQVGTGSKLSEVKVGDIKIVRSKDAKPGDEEGCGAALLTLKIGVSEARQALEISRTSSAAGALHRALGEREALDTLIKKYQEKK